MRRCTEAVPSEVFGAVRGLAATLPVTLPDLHGVLHEHVKVLRVVGARLGKHRLPFPTSWAKNQSRVTFLRHPDTKSRYPTRYVFWTARCLASFVLFRRKLVQYVILVPNVTSLGSLVLEGFALQMIARAALTGGEEFTRVAIFPIVLSDEEDIAEAALVSMFVVVAATGGPAAGVSLEAARRMIVQLVLNVF